MNKKPLVHIENLNVEFPLGRKLFGKPPMLKAVNCVSMDIMHGQFFGLVGESGSGKTTLGRAILKAVPISSGKILFDDGKVSYDLGKISQTDLKNYRKLAQLIFQDPYAALSPRMTVRDIIAEPLEVMGITKSRDETDERVREIASKCRLNLEHLRRFPHAFSGGQRQRISIARTLVCNPDFVVADEIQRRVCVSASNDEFSDWSVLFNDFPKVVDGYSRHHGSSFNAKTIDFSDVDSFADEHDLLRSEEDFCGPGGVLVRLGWDDCYSASGGFLPSHERMDSTQSRL